MEAKREKEFIAKDYRRFKGSSFLKKFGLLEKVFIIIFDILCLIIRGTFSRYNVNPNIVIISLHRLGDTVFSIPAIREIIRFYDNHIPYIICYPETVAIYSIEFPDVNYRVMSRNEFNFGRRIAAKSAKDVIIKINPSVVYDLTGTPASASLIWNLPTNMKVGTNIRYFKNLYNAYSPIRKTPHLMDIYWDVVKLKIPVKRKEYYYCFEQKEIKNNSILIHPFAILNAKEWKLNRFLSLGSILCENYPVKIVVPPGFLGQDVLDEMNGQDYSFIITEDINSLIKVIKECSLFISNDSGPTYIASLLGKATFSIYGPTNPDFSFPIGKHHKFFQKQLKCTPHSEKVCFTRGGIDCPSNECMNSISVEEVARSVKEFLEELGIQKSHKL